jgi:hypothetical protein
MNCALSFILLSSHYKQIQDNIKKTSKKLSDCADIKNEECSLLIDKYVNLLYQKDKVEKDLIKNSEECSSDLKMIEFSHTLSTHLR